MRAGSPPALGSIAVPEPAPDVLAPRLRPRRWVEAALALVLVVLLAACQVQVKVDTVVDRDGAGTVTVSVGFDQAAWARLQATDPQVQLDDVRQAGWQVSEPAAGADGITWIRASKPFASPEELTAVLAEVAPDGTMFKGFDFTRVESDDDITYRVTGQVDLTQGLATFADPTVAAQLGGDPFGGNVAQIETEEGRPVSEMVSFEVSTSVAGGPSTTVRPTLTDTAPVPIDVATVEVKPPSFLIRVAVGAAVVVGVVLVVVALVGVRRRVNAR